MKSPYPTISAVILSRVDGQGSQDLERVKAEKNSRDSSLCSA